MQLSISFSFKLIWNNNKKRYWNRDLQNLKNMKHNFKAWTNFSFSRCHCFFFIWRSHLIRFIKLFFKFLLWIIAHLLWKKSPLIKEYANNLFYFLCRLNRLRTVFRSLISISQQKLIYNKKFWNKKEIYHAKLTRKSFKN